MTKEDIKKHFPEATDEQINELLNINSRDIGEYKKAAEDSAAELKTAKDTIADLEKNKGDIEALQKVVNDYRAAEDKRQADAKAAADRAERLGRFEKAHTEVSRGAEWYNDFTREGIFSRFEKALADDSYKGKSDIQIYTALTTDEKGIKEGLYKPKVNGSMGGPMGGNVGGAKNYAEKKYERNPFVQQFMLG